MLTDLLQQTDVWTRVVDSSISPTQVRRFQELVRWAQDCGLLVPAHRYVVALDPPHIEMPTERVQGSSLEDALREGRVRLSDVTDAVLALLRLGREVLRAGGDMLCDVSLADFVHGQTTTHGYGVYFTDLEPVFASWDRDLDDPGRGVAYGQLVANAADLILEIEEIADLSLSPCRLAALAICAEIEEQDPDQPWTALLREALIDNRPSLWRDWPALKA